MIGIFTFLRAILNLVIVPLLTVFYSIFTLCIVVPFGNQQTADRVIHHWAKILCWLAGVRVHVSGLENLRGLPTSILVSNHLSHYDIPVLYTSLPLSFRMVAKAELFRLPFFGLAMRKLGFVPIDRETSDGARNALNEMAAKALQQETIWIAAEGTRYEGVGIGEFKSGAFHMATKTGHPIVPIAIYGTQRVLPKKSFLVSRGRRSQDVFVKVCRPVWPPIAEKSSSRHILKDQVRQVIVQEFETLRTTNAGTDLHWVKLGSPELARRSAWAWPKLKTIRRF